MHFVKGAPGFCWLGRVTSVLSFVPSPSFKHTANFPLPVAVSCFFPGSNLPARWFSVALAGMYGTYLLVSVHTPFCSHPVLLVIVTNHSSVTHLDSKEGALERHNNTAPLPLGSPANTTRFPCCRCSLHPWDPRWEEAASLPFLQLFLAQGLSLPSSNSKAGKISMKPKGQLDGSFRSFEHSMWPGTALRANIQNYNPKPSDRNFRGLALLLIHFSR